MKMIDRGEEEMIEIDVIEMMTRRDGEDIGMKMKRMMRRFVTVF